MVSRGIVLQSLWFSYIYLGFNYSVTVISNKSVSLTHFFQPPHSVSMGVISYMVTSGGFALRGVRTPGFVALRPVRLTSTPS